uniref:response regulator n=1 Tax=Candidatus Fimivicinus sp. TaxID=3056640 RepID=UPI003FEFA231
MTKSILIIEDDKNIAELERDYLEANGYEVDTKFNGEEGLEAALKRNYSLILLDLMLPGMD